jgi:hypothetical protein
MLSSTYSGTAMCLESGVCVSFPERLKCLWGFLCGSMEIQQV